ncbi:cytochrome c-type biogenesis protein [Thermoanaerobacter thermohydrosulfuricus]|uniref:Cytochrome c biogenesis protein n=2 Tax=Thermoanaerobacter thermohydrosulfuricus TaxID=1516 RepID=M8CNW9_THETY|nr:MULTISPECIES: cytochrome c biogenesis protein CcdA [Thermoanaerobacter]EMT38815.1 Cytochrome c biogenesis protein [Thermoanaerobacter thermohydrosulfuricus WC1]SDG50415.1 cytochrome c-type biogenesis protein [Thermoanaerobacter thermohydrosulfuricus]SFE45633.1 cytochrome c-type biogenesis protein [Thermoanaerobacter thermohydrosulfuricus]
MAYVLPFIAGVASFLSPCIIPMISVYFSLITGMSIKDLKDVEFHRAMRKFILINTFVFVLAFTIVFTLVGGLSGTIGKWLSSYISIMNVIGGILIIAMGLNLIGLINLNFSFLSKYSAHEIKTSSRYLTTFLIGLFFAIVCSHCIGPVLYSMLIYTATTGSALIGIKTMFLFSIGLAVPYLLVGYYMPEAIKVIKKTKKYQNIISIILGTFLIFLGFLTTLGKIQDLTTFLSRLLPFKLPLGM